MNKNQRNYKLTVGPTYNGSVLTDPTITTIEPPFSLQFDVKRQNLQSTNAATLQIYNLGSKTRLKLARDTFASNIRKEVQLYAGYGNIMPTIFKGNMSHGWSVRDGVNYVTTLECFDGGDANINGTFNGNFVAGTPTKVIIAAIMSTLPGVGIGKIGGYTGTLSKGQAYSGNSAELLSELTGGGFFIDNGKAYALKNNEAALGQIGTINSDSGLIGTPVRSETKLSFGIIFEPRVLMSQPITIDSITGGNYKGEYKVIGIHHSGMISETVSGNAITTLDCLFGLDGFTVLT